MLKRNTTALVFLLLFAAFAAGQNPKFVVPDQKILGADKPIKLGKLVRLHVSPVKDPVEHLASTAYTWKVFDFDTKDKVLVELDDVEDGKRVGSIIFGSGIEAKKLTAICIITHLYIVKDKDGKVTEVATRTNVLDTNVIIGSPTPGPDPGPNPGPDPGPDPVFPDGTYKLSALAYKTAMAKVTDPTVRSKGAVALAKSHRGIASSIAAGAFPTLKAALVQAATANNQALKDAGVKVEDWDAYGTAIQDVLYDLYSNKKMGTAADLGTACLEIAAGLEKVK